MKKLTIGILGATSYVAKSIIPYFNKDKYEVIQYNRILSEIGKKRLQEFIFIEKFDVIINCVYSHKVDETFEISEKYDSLILDYLFSKPDTIYINLSSGAIYKKNSIDVSNISQQDYYCINKLYHEAKHRSLKNLNIVDIRLFSFFSRFINLNSHYFLAQIINSIKNKKEFETNDTNIIRDYVHPEDLFQLIECCIKQKNINDFYDTYSLSFSSKFSVLKFFVEKYNLIYSIKDLDIEEVTGFKERYYSKNIKASEIGYKPKYSSLETIEDEVKWII